MIRHVVMWKLRGPSAQERREQASRLRAELEGLSGKIPGMSSLEVGISDAAADEQIGDLVLITTHESWEGLQAYQAHPAHQAVAKLVGEVRTERRVVDFEVT